MLSSILRSSARRTPSLYRHVATRSKAQGVPGAKPASTEFPALPLPAKKMRALISIYHQTESFITPANLDAIIDDAFIYRHNDLSMMIGNEKEKDMSTLRRELAARRDMPRIGDAKNMLKNPPVPMYSSRDIGTPFSSPTHPREQQVSYALYGLERDGLPGLEILEEEHARIQRYRREDKEQQATEQGQ